MKSLFITGATGFIGGRLAEVAVERGIQTTALVRSWVNAARLARLPVRMVPGNMLNLDSVRAAMKGCDVVVHCAVDWKIWGPAHSEASWTGTRNVMQAALDLEVKRVVHMSSAAVHGYRPDADASTEEGAYTRNGDAYCRGKIEAEKVALRFQREFGVPVTVLRPTIVYGPFGVESLETVTLLRKGQMVLVNKGTGVCNALHVDNLVDAVFLSLENDAAVGEVFHVSDARTVSWREFIEPHARVIDPSLLPLREMTEEEISAARSRLQAERASSIRQTLKLLRDPAVRRALGTVPLVRRLASTARRIVTVLPSSQARGLLEHAGNDNSKPASKTSSGSGLPPKGKVQVYTNSVTFSIEKAKRILGYDPRIPISKGIEETCAWVKWARL